MLLVKNPPANAGDKDMRIRSLGQGEGHAIPQKRAWQPTPVFLPGESFGQGRLLGYSPWGHKESDSTEVRHMYIHITAIFDFNPNYGININPH